MERALFLRAHLEAQNLDSTNDYTRLPAGAVDRDAGLAQRWQAAACFGLPTDRQGSDWLRVEAYAFPKIPGVAIPRSNRRAFRLDFSVEPPKLGPPFPTLVPQVNPDGNETSGIKHAGNSSSARIQHGLESAQPQNRRVGSVVHAGRVLDSVPGE